MSESLSMALNRQTAKIAWSALEKFFAQGLVIQVDPTLDLIDVAVKFNEDDTHAIQEWLQSNQIRKVSDQQAATYHREDTMLWAVVIDPWVLVQSITSPGK